ncbi:hypothetical protein ON010_g13645 [Phytophthora cinnamomi]|nr:hypothetical protein ON010_g13645 [Phytophthora cinnamomi]
MTSRTSVLASSRVVPLAPSFFNSVSPDQAIRDVVVSKTNINLIPRPEGKRLRHYSSQLRFNLQWRPAAKMQLLVVRNALACAVTAVLVNGCFYTGNVFSFKSSTKQSRPEFLMALLVWTALIHAAKMIVAYVPMLVNQRFIESPDSKPSLWFCARKLVISTSPYFTVLMAGMIGTGLLIQNTSLMHEHFNYKLHFYFAALCNHVFTAGISLAVRNIYYEETCQGRDRRSAMNQMSARKLTMNTQHRPRHRPPARKGHRPLNYRASGFWKEFVTKFPSPLLVALAGGFVHVVAWYRILDRGTVIIMGFTAVGIVIKLGLQEAARHYIIKKRIRSIRTMRES